MFGAAQKTSEQTWRSWAANLEEKGDNEHEEETTADYRSNQVATGTLAGRPLGVSVVSLAGFVCLRISKSHNTSLLVVGIQVPSDIMQSLAPGPWG